MNELQSNARRAFLRPANQRESPHTRSRIIGVILPVTIASTYSATAQLLSAPHVGFDCETLEQRNVKGVPRQEHTREATSYLFYISLDNPPGEWVGLWAVVGHSPKGEEKRRSTGKLLPHAPFFHRFQGLRCQLATFEKFLSEFCSPR